MAAGDAVPIPRKNVAYRHYFEIRDTAGALISGATGLDSEVSIDGAAFADMTAEATEIGASGTYFLDYTAGEMNGDGVVVVVKTTSVNAIIPVIVLYPESLGDLRVNVGQWDGAAVAAPDTAGYPVVTIKDGAGAGEVQLAAGKVDVGSWNGTVVAAPDTAGYPVVTIKDGVGAGEVQLNAGQVEVAAAQLVTLINSIWDELTAEARTAGSYGQLFKDNLPVLVTPANKLLTDAAGRVELQADGLDQIVVETGVNARQALAVLGSALAGVLAGVGSGTITIEAMNNPGTVRITCVNDLLGNRNTVVLNLPA